MMRCGENNHNVHDGYEEEMAPSLDGYEKDMAPSSDVNDTDEDKSKKSNSLKNCQGTLFEKDPQT